MTEKNEVYSQDDEISLIDLFAVLWHRKVMILVITLIAMVGVVVFSIISLVLPTETSPLPNTYTPSALMLINNTSSSGGAMAAALGATGLGGLAGLAGVSTGPTFSELAIYLVGTNTLLDAVVDEFDLISRYEIKKYFRSESRKILKKQLTAASDEKSGVFTISFTDTDPVFAQDVVNFCVLFLEKRFDELAVDQNKLEKENLEINIANTYQEIQNLEQEFHRLEYSVVSGGRMGSIPAITLEQNRITMELQTQKQVYTQLKVQYEMLKVSMASEKPVFQILEMAEVPDQKSGPSRGLICIIVTFAAGFFSVFLAFVLNAISNIRNDPEAMAKLQGSSKKK
ncbi:MAG: lipopolysaccharide biosynthesis protein [Treponema sp.]|jgi:uncharacterized protein involved in exopolysaccharide biosynthesis|nr:lipopolysaccharide biosynthesis protein [Treponema sp.]